MELGLCKKASGSLDSPATVQNGKSIRTLHSPFTCLFAHTNRAVDVNVS